MWILRGILSDLNLVGLCWVLVMESTIWGLSKQGKICKACRLCVHTKCELKVKTSLVAVSSRLDESESRFRRTAQKQCLPGLLSPVQSRYHPISVRLVRTNEILVYARILTFIPATSVTTQSPSSFEPLKAPVEESHQTATVLFDFTPFSESELGVRREFALLTLPTGNLWLAEGMTVRILEPDDGSGWVKVIDPCEKSGLVPTSYIGTGDKSLEDISRIQGSSRRGQWHLSRCPTLISYWVVGSF